MLIPLIPFQTGTTTTTTTTTIKTSKAKPITIIVPVPSAVLVTTGNVSYYYSPYFGGYGVTEDFVNPGNDEDSSPPFVTELSVTDEGDVCGAVERCAQLTIDDEGIYYSFDVHYLLDKGYWECVQFFDENVDPRYFDQRNSTVGYALGYYN